MHSAAEPRLLEFFVSSDDFKSLNKRTKAALRLCNKQLKSAIDATIFACKIKSADLDHFLGSNWPITELIIVNNNYSRQPSTVSVKPFLAALLGKLPLLKKLQLEGDADLPENIGGFSRLQTLHTDGIIELAPLPPSFSQLTALERLVLFKFAGMTREGLAPLKHLKQLRYIHV